MSTMWQQFLVCLLLMSASCRCFGNPTYEQRQRRSVENVEEPANPLDDAPVRSDSDLTESVAYSGKGELNSDDKLSQRPQSPVITYLPPWLIYFQEIWNEILARQDDLKAKFPEEFERSNVGEIASDDQQQLESTEGGFETGGSADGEASVDGLNSSDEFEASQTHVSDETENSNTESSFSDNEISWPAPDDVHIPESSDDHGRHMLIPHVGSFVAGGPFMQGMVNSAFTVWTKLEGRAADDATEPSLLDDPTERTVSPDFVQPVNPFQTFAGGVPEPDNDSLYPEHSDDTHDDTSTTGFAAVSHPVDDFRAYPDHGDGFLTNDAHSTERDSSS